MLLCCLTLCKLLTVNKPLCGEGKATYQGLKLLLLIEAVGEQPLAIRDMEALLSTLVQASFGAESGHAYKMACFHFVGKPITVYSLYQGSLSRLG